MAAAGYADDLIPLSPSREAMVKMLKICEDYGTEHNLVFSTDPVPKKSKSKSVYFCGTTTNVQYPAPLNNKDLPWVVSATHLGHELHQSATMDYDIKTKRGRFIGDSTEVRETFSFGEPNQVLRAVRLYCGHYYGGMLWDLESEAVGMFCRCWNTCVKLTHDIPRSTHTYIVENILAPNYLPVKTELMARFLKFHDNLLSSQSLEVKVLVSIVKQDVRSVTAKNMALIARQCGKVTCDKISPSHVRQLVRLAPIPENQEWRGPLLLRLLQERRDLKVDLQNTEELSEVIDSLCSS